MHFQKHARLKADWRVQRARTEHKVVTALSRVNEEPLYLSIGRILHDYIHESNTLQEMQRSGQLTPHQLQRQLQQASVQYEDQMAQHSMRALRMRDRRVVEYAAKERATGFRALLHSGVLVPPWLAWGDSVDMAIQVTRVLASYYSVLVEGSSPSRSSARLSHLCCAAGVRTPP